MSKKMYSKSDILDGQNSIWVSKLIKSIFYILVFLVIYVCVEYLGHGWVNHLYICLFYHFLWLIKWLIDPVDKISLLIILNSYCIGVTLKYISTNLRWLTCSWISWIIWLFDWLQKWCTNQMSYAIKPNPNPVMIQLFYIKI